LRKKEKLSLSDYDLILPNIPTDEEFAGYIEESEGLPKEAFKSLKFGYSLLKNIINEKATVERLGWLNLWSKTMMAFDSARLAYSRRSDSVGSGSILKIIYRSTFEYKLHSMVLANLDAFVEDNEELSDKVVALKQSPKYVRNQIRERLRAYTVWCLWSDKAYYEELIHPKTLLGVWNPEPAREMLKHDKFRNIQEKLFAPIFGQIPAETNEELREGYKSMKEFYEEKINLINFWISDSKLLKYAHKIKTLSREKRCSFFAILDPDISSVAKQLSIFESRFAYGEYKLGSMILHGSSLEQFLSIGESVIYPNFILNKNQVDHIFDGIIISCNQIFFGLALINNSCI
jgi:hypothetical protein